MYVVSSKPNDLPTLGQNVPFFWLYFNVISGLVAKTKNHKRNISAGNLCPTCGKVYLGFVRMKRHFIKYPDHGSIEYLNTIHNSNPDSEGKFHSVVENTVYIFHHSAEKAVIICASSLSQRKLAFTRPKFRAIKNDQLILPTS